MRLAWGAFGPLGSGKEQEACVMYKKAKEQGAGRERKGGQFHANMDMVRGGGRTLNGFNRRT